MKNALLIHGMPSKEEYYDPSQPALSNHHWFSWLQRQLLLNDIFTQSLEMPRPFDPDYKKWKKEFERFDIDNETILIGHSCGGGFLIRWLSENTISIDQLFLIAPWIDPEKELKTDFFDFSIDPTLQKRINKIHLFVSEDDKKSILKSADLILEKLSTIAMHRDKNKGHYCLNDLKTEQFPELLDAILA